jgi:hypothetical protein
MNNANNDPTVDKQRFPLTTQEGLSPQDQAFIDAINLDQLQEAEQNGERLSFEEEQRFKELKEKAEIRKNRTAQ